MHYVKEQVVERLAMLSLKKRERERGVDLSRAEMDVCWETTDFYGERVDRQALEKALLLDPRRWNGGCGEGGTVAIA